MTVEDLFYGSART